MLQGCTVLKLCWMCLKTKSEWMKQRKTQDVRHKGKNISFAPKRFLIEGQNESVDEEWECAGERLSSRKIPTLPKAEVTRPVIHFILVTLPHIWGGKSCKRKRGIHSYVLLSLAFYLFLAFHSGTLPGNLKRSGASGLKSEKHPWLNYSVREFKGPMCNV